MIKIIDEKLFERMNYGNMKREYYKHLKALYKKLREIENILINKNEKEIGVRVKGNI